MPRTRPARGARTGVLRTRSAWARGGRSSRRASKPRDSRPTTATGWGSDMAHDKEPGTELVVRGRATKALPVAATGGSRGKRSRTDDARQNAYARPRGGSDEDIVDAEFVDESEPQDASNRRERLRDSAREFFGAKTKARMADRERRRVADEARTVSDDASTDERVQLLTLRAEVKRAGEQYM